MNRKQNWTLYYGLLTSNQLGMFGEMIIPITIKPPLGVIVNRNAVRFSYSMAFVCPRVFSLSKEGNNWTGLASHELLCCHLPEFLTLRTRINLQQSSRSHRVTDVWNARRNLNRPHTNKPLNVILLKQSRLPLSMAPLILNWLTDFLDRDSIIFQNLFLCKNKSENTFFHFVFWGLSIWGTSRAQRGPQLWLCYWVAIASSFALQQMDLNCILLVVHPLFILT